jgi:GNAT superfamily N-acetyltransferase
MTIDTLPDDGAPQRVTVRPARTQDTRLIQAYIRSLSPASRRNRFLGPLNELSAIELHRMTHSDHGSYPALLAEIVVEGVRTMIGEARYAVMPDGFTCEFAVSVAEPWRRRKLGTLLVGIVASRAVALGIRYLVGDVFRSNDAVIALARKTGFAVTESAADARLVKITKNLSLLAATSFRNELASQSWSIADGLSYGTPTVRQETAAVRDFEPVFDGQGPALFQSLAIMEYLDETHPQPPLLPQAPI